MEYRVQCPDRIHIPRVGKRDSKYKLSINPKKNKAHCFRCGFGTSNAKKFCDEYNIEIDADFTATNDPVYVPTLKLPKEYSNIFTGTEGRKAHNYLKSRGIEREVISGYELGFCEEGRFAGRIIIPVYSHGDLVNYQARDYTGTCDKALRYMGPSSKEGAQASILFNLDRIKKNSIVVLTEGPLDALRLPEFAVGCIGSGWNSTKKDQLLSKSPKVLLFAFDRDGTVDGHVEKIKKDLEGVIETINELPFTSKDLGSISEFELGRCSFICRQIEKIQEMRPEGIQQTMHGKVSY